MQKVSYMGDGVTTEFFFNFPFFETSNVVVTLNNEPATGYSIIGTSGGMDADIPYIGGKVVFDVAPTALDCVTIARQLPLERIVDYQPLSKIDPATLNQDLNYEMEVIKDRKDELNDLTTKYAEIADKESTQILLAKMEAVTNLISKFEEDIEQGRIMSKDDFYSYTTNCITEIPQDIKLELNDGTVTLKAGSVVYIPNGVNVFDKYTISSDSTVGSGGTYTGKGLVFYKKSDNTLARLAVTQVYSGSTQPVSDGYWYNTTDNVIYWINSGTALDRDIALPLAEVTVDNGTITNIDQVFNGFGYIGSTVFALPGVKGLIPNGRNVNGTLKNINMSTTNVIIRTFNATTTAYIGMQANSFGAIPIANYTYDEKENKQYSGGTAFTNSFVIGKCVLTAGVISNWQIKTAFHALDYSSADS